MHSSAPVVVFVCKIAVCLAAFCGGTASGADLPSPGTNSPTSWSYSESVAETGLGSYFVGAGDVDGDGFADLLVGLPFWRDSKGRAVGKVMLFPGSATGLGASPSWQHLGSDPNSNYGAILAGGRDLNGDGVSDIAIGANLLHRQIAQEGGAYVFYGQRGPLRDKADWAYYGGSRFQVLGGVLTMGDFNGDGIADLLVFARDQPVDLWYLGRLLVFFGRKGGLPTEPDQEILGPFRPEADFGTSISSVGDVNGDGFEDVLIGAHHYQDREINQGRVFLYYGSPTGLQTNAGWENTYQPRETPGTVSARFQIYGYAVGKAGDVNGDGLSDFLVGTPAGDHGEINEGLCFCFHGARGTISSTPQWMAESNQDEGALGVSICGVGDVNHDGFDDVVVGARSTSHRVAREGVVGLYLGSPKGLGTVPGWTAEGGASGSEFGAKVAFLGDINRDGYNDFAVGIPSLRSEGKKVGGLRVYYGGPSGPSGSSAWSPTKASWENLRDQLNSQVSSLGWKLIPALLLLSAIVYWLVPRFLASRKHALIAEQAILDERRRLARDLHDELGGFVARVSILTGRMEDMRDQAASVGNEARSMRETVKEMRDALEAAVWAIEPDNDSLESVITLIDGLTESMLTPSGIHSELSTPDPLSTIHVSHSVRRELRLCLKEAFTNVIKHSGASKVRVQLSHTRTTGTITIEDDGCGMSSRPNGSEREGGSTGRGLLNIVVRLSNVGGNAHFESGPTGGARITLSFPIALVDASAGDVGRSRGIGNTQELPPI